MTHHKLDPWPIPTDKTPMYINEPWIIDKTLLEYEVHIEPEEEDDNIRIYAPLDLNRKAILRRLDRVIAQYEEANEANEMEFGVDVNMILFQVEIYDQIWYVRHMPKEGQHSSEAVSLIKEVIERLENIPDGCAECFPFETIDELKQEYGL